MERVKKTRTRLFIKAGIKKYDEAHKLRQELVARVSIDGITIDKVRVIVRRSRSVFDVIAYGPLRDVEDE